MIDQEVPRVRDTADGHGFVEFVDPSYAQWRVSERDARRDLGARGERCLLFACTGMIRRVWDYPADWRTLSAPDLMELSLRR